MTKKKGGGGGNDDATDEENRRYIKERVRDLLQCVSVKHLIIFFYELLLLLLNTKRNPIVRGIRVGNSSRHSFFHNAQSSLFIHLKRIVSSYFFFSFSIPSSPPGNIDHVL